MSFPYIPPITLLGGDNLSILIDVGYSDEVIEHMNRLLEAGYSMEEAIDEVGIVILSPNRDA